MPRAHTTAVSPGTNYNYQVALNEGLQYLKQGRLRQAEQSFKYLVDKFPGAEGGYRGLAKVHFEQEDRASALRVLRDGAAALTKSGERPQAIGLLREAITLEPRDLATHARPAAAHALAGDPDAAPTAPGPRPPPAPSAPTTVWAESPAERAAKTPADVWSTPSAAAPAPQTPAETTAAAQADDVEVEAAAARYLATRDPRAAELALEAARRYLKDGRTDAASDLLLQLIAAGVADHDAQRLLVEVARTLGKREVARAKCQLLVQALLLDGRNDLAAEVEALARAD